MADFYDRFGFYRTWPWVVLTALLFLAGVQIYKVNAPKESGDAGPSGAPLYWTRGAVFTGVQVVPGGRFLAARMDLNKRSDLTGSFSVVLPKDKINCLVIPAGELEKWQTGQEYKRIAETGYVPSGRIVRVLEPGSYFLILDNQSSPADREVNANFTVD